MVEKVTAAGEEVATAQGTPQTVSPLQGQQGPSGQSQPGSSGGSSEVAGGGGGAIAGTSPSMADPAEHLKIQNKLADPNGHCRCCGHEIADDATLCPHCGLTREDWNAKIADFVARAKAAGWNDAQIREGGQEFANNMKQDLDRYGQTSHYYQPYGSATQAQEFISHPSGYIQQLK